MPKTMRRCSLVARDRGRKGGMVEDCKLREINSWGRTATDGNKRDGCGRLLPRVREGGRLIVINIHDTLGLS